MLNVKEIATKYAEQVWNAKELAAVDLWVAGDVVIHSLLGDYSGAEAMKAVIKAWLAAFPDLIVTNETIITENDLVSIQWNAKGTHRGDFKGRKPTEKTVSYKGVTVYRIRNGKITEYWAYLDMDHLFNQISVPD